MQQSLLSNSGMILLLDEWNSDSGREQGGSEADRPSPEDKRWSAPMFDFDLFRDLLSSFDKELSLVKHNKLHWQVRDSDGCPLCDIWPTVSKYLRLAVVDGPHGRWSHPVRGVKAKVGTYANVLTCLLDSTPPIPDKVSARRWKRSDRKKHARKKKKDIAAIRPPRTIPGRPGTEEAPF